MLQILNGRFGPWHYPSIPADGIELDIGCGRGSFTLQLAANHPDRLVIGADVMMGRLRRCEKQAKRMGLDNFQLLRASAAELIPRMLPDRSLRRVHILCPDPWPKTKHRANRLVTSEFLARVATKIAPGGALHLATDDRPYLAWMQAAIAELPQYQRDDAVLSDVTDIQTDFEREFARKDIPVIHLGFRLTV